jgi:glutamate synthase domain-containing protein 2
MYENGSFSLGSTDANAKTTLRAQWKNLYHFVEGGNGGLSKTRREMMFINLLESVHPLEAEILILVKDKELDTKYKVPFEVVKEAFPEIRWGGR